jgi:hypothetical protein
MNDENGIWMRPLTAPALGDYGSEDIHMCTICHALTPRNNSGPHYRWHSEQAALMRDMVTEYRSLAVGGNS